MPLQTGKKYTETYPLRVHPDFQDIRINNKTYSFFNSVTLLKPQTYQQPLLCHQNDILYLLSPGMFHDLSRQ